jgi:hypothetical protein
MKKFFEFTKREIAEVIPPAIFFFVAFNIVAVTRALMLREYGISVFDFLAATVGALLVAKIILIVDLIPFVNRYPGKPLIYNVVWKTFVYVLAALVVRYIEHLVPLVFKYGSLAAANERLLAEIVWPHFWAIHIWLTVLLFLYCTLRETISHLGRERTFQMFFGTPSQRISP